MKGMRGVSALAPAAILACWCAPAEAYRPFDGTDAAVAGTGEMEIELGPVEYLRDGADRTLLAPDVRINYGFTPGWEASLEGDVAHGLTTGTPVVSVIESEALLKGVLREGSLQEKSGPSIAAEFGLLLPGINDEHGTGAILTGIASHRWDWATVHLNAQIALTREQHADYFLDTIIEGPQDWVVRPVSELFYERDVSLFQTRSALVGAIWQVQDNIAVDFAVRGARVNDHTAGEIRAGVNLRLRRNERAGSAVGPYCYSAPRNSLAVQLSFPMPANPGPPPKMIMNSDLRQPPLSRLSARSSAVSAAGNRTTREGVVVGGS